MDVSLTPEVERFVSERVSAGDYDSASAVIREGLRPLQERDREHESRLAELRAAINAGLTAAERGEIVEGEGRYALIPPALHDLAEPRPGAPGSGCG